MITTLLLFLSTALPQSTAEQWTLRLIIHAWDQRIVLELPAASYLECEEMRDSWLVDGPRDREGWESVADCVVREQER